MAKKKPGQQGHAEATSPVPEFFGGPPAPMIKIVSYNLSGGTLTVNAVCRLGPLTGGSIGAYMMNTTGATGDLSPNGPAMSQTSPQFTFNNVPGGQLFALEVFVFQPGGSGGISVVVSDGEIIPT